MIEPGYDYRIETIEGSDHHYRTVTVTDWNAPLAKVTDGDKEAVMNFSASNFVRAEKLQRMANPLKSIMDKLSSDDREL